MASEFNCLDQLNTYANYLSSNPFTNAPRPQPLLWTDVNCSGNALLPLDQAYQDNTDYANVYGSSFNSLYVPVGWKVTLRYNNLQIQYPAAGADASIPVLIEDFSQLYYPNSNQVIRDHVSTLDFVAPDTVNDWKLQMCNNEISTVVGARHLTSYQSGSLECDGFMSGYCHDVAALGCAPNSTQPAPLPEKFRYCVCLVEENCLKSTFCTPGSTDTNCQTNDAFEEFIPVTCFGKNCSLEGYRWGRMQNQRCNITLCQQIIRLVGNEIVVRGGSTMWCGNQTIPVTSVSPTVTQTPPSAGGVHLSTWAWLAIGVGLFALAVVLPLAVILWRRSFKKSESTPALHETTPARPLTESASSPEFQSVSNEAL